jgi:hypothetical protein
MRATVDLYWLPLGAGGWFVRLNGRVYEQMEAFREHRSPLDLYHTALEVTVPEGRFVIENAWPIGNSDLAARGVTSEGPVWDHRLGRFRVFRYEVRCWPNGTIADIAEAVASPQRVSADEAIARRVLELATEVPREVWGRDELQLGEMWNSNSVISWLLTRAGVPASTSIRPTTVAPRGGWRECSWPNKPGSNERRPLCQLRSHNLAISEYPTRVGSALTYGPTSSIASAGLPRL